MSPKVLEMRRQSASNVLLSLQTALKTIEKQAGCIRDLQRMLPLKGSQIDRHLISLNNKSKELREQIENYFDERGETLPEAISGPLNSTEQSLQNLRETIESARIMVRELIGLRLESARFAERQQTFERQASALKEPSIYDPLKELKDVWQEGLDLISGLCLRHEGLDGGLCRIADDIIAQIRWIGVKPISVPGRGGPGHLTSIVHLRFPEWTIWALPLTAHELWRLGIRSPEGARVLDRMLEITGRTDAAAQKRLKDESVIYWKDENLQLCLADVFGVHVMGPAYACAAISLVLDPFDMNDNQRAQSMLRALQVTGEYAQIHAVLDEQWREAAKQSSGPASLKYSEWIDAVMMYLDEVVSKFNLDRWKEVRSKWPEALRYGETGSIDAERADIQCALAAGWKARLEYPDQHHRIADSCFELCNKILEPAPSRNVLGI